MVRMPGNALHRPENGLKSAGTACDKDFTVPPENRRKISRRLAAIATCTERIMHCTIRQMSERHEPVLSLTWAAGRRGLEIEDTAC
jgi:predicted phage gp36 major capsid-like protein